MGASDIMFQEYPHRLRVRYKLDGDWFDEIGDFPGHISKQVISRIKVISGLEIQYVRLPQDGSFPIKIGDQRYDFRVNTSYHAQGEQAVLRLQRDHRRVRALAELGMPSQYAQAIGEMMNGDNGLLILCGPTGSGNTRTRPLAIPKGSIEARPDLPQPTGSWITAFWPPALKKS
jgi:type II secretory ATPase GspE/PulE/Tfp pilus assembly ATPase PilB-like protein